MQQIIINSTSELPSAAKELLAACPDKKTFAFYGQMGAGKTTFIKSLCEELGVNNTVSSPTFSIVNEYQANYNLMVYHFDMYRLKSEIEALDMGIDDYLYSGNWCFIEWAEKIPNLIPDNYTTVQLSHTVDGKRSLRLT